MSKNIQVDYKQWGLGSVPKNLAISIDDKRVKAALIAVQKIFPINDLYLKSAMLVNFFQGKSSSDKELLLLRFNASNIEKNNFGQSHISVLINPTDNKIFGIMDLRDSEAVKEYTTHKDALNAAVLFLQKVAPDYVSQKIQLPGFSENKLESGVKYTFNEQPKLDLLELHWIGGHSEFVQTKNGAVEIRGMKVKLYNRKDNLWTWVIINKNNEVICYERDVFWNFDEFRRDSQMWLHDNWLIAHHLI